MIAPRAFVIPALRPYERPCFGSNKYLRFGCPWLINEWTTCFVESVELLSTTMSSYLTPEAFCVRTLSIAAGSISQRLNVLITTVMSVFRFIHSACDTQLEIK